LGAQVATLPIVTRQPRAATEVIGGNVSFAVAAGGAGPLSFQWRRDGAPLSGATTGVLFLPAVQTRHAGNYDCIINNAAGFTTSSPAPLIVIAANPPADPLDPTFTLEAIFTPAPTVAALQTDGKILLGGAFVFSNQGRPQSGLARLNSDGTLDHSFAPGLLNDFASIAIISVQPDGKIIVAGSFSTIGGLSRRNLARLNANGSIDPSFTPPPTVGSQLRQIELTSDGHLLLVDGSSGLLKLNTDGTTDPAWRFSPIQIGAGSGTSVNLVTCTVERIGLFPDGRIAVVAMTPLIASSIFNPFSPPPPPSQFSVLRSLGANGADQGNLYFTGQISNFPRELRVMADGSILLISATGILERLTPPTTSGSYTLIAQSFIGSSTCVSVTPEGKLWVGGAFSVANDTSGPLFSGVPSIAVPRRNLARLNPDFSPDSCDPGLGLTTADGAAVAPRFIVALPDGRALLGGDFVRVNGTHRPQLARLNAQSRTARNPAAILDLAYPTPRAGEPYVVTARITGSPPFFFPNGYTYDAVTGTATFTLKTIGRQFARVANSLGAGVLEEFNVVATPSIPVFATQPESVQTNSGRSFTLGLSAVGTGPFSYQWFKNGEPVSGGTAATYRVNQASDNHAGEYHVAVRNALGTVDSERVHVGIDEQARFINFSAQGVVRGTDFPLLVGFVTRGVDGKRVLIRAVGPTLASAPFSVPGALDDPSLSLFDVKGTVVFTNDNWSDETDLARLALELAGRLVGAFPLRNFSGDSAGSVSINSGIYLATVSGSARGAQNPTGVALAEIYETDSASGRLANFSARCLIGPNAPALIAGFVIAPIPSGATKRILIRGVGPGLTAFGVTDALANPIIHVIANTGHTVATNDDWETNVNLAELRAVTAQLTFPLPANSRDAALLITLPPGAYTCIVSGVNNTTGTALVEVYEVP